MENLVIIFGGNSPESDVSVITAMQAAAAADKGKYKLYPVYYSGDKFYLGRTFEVSEYADFDRKNAKIVTFSDGNMIILKNALSKKTVKVHCVLNCCHGGDGENGNLAGYFETTLVPYTSAKPLAAAVSMDKYLSKIVFSGLGLDVVPAVLATEKNFSEKLFEAEEKIGYPLIVKPVDLGSSIGVKIAKDEKQAGEAAKVAFAFSEKVLLEKCLENFTELNVAAMRTIDQSVAVSPVERPVFKGEIFDFADKYLAGEKGGLEEAGREFPAKIPEAVAEKAQNIAKKIYEELEFSGPVRIDFMLACDTLYVGEVNSVPGSLSAYLLEAAGIPFEKLVDEAVLFARAEFERKKGLQKSFESAILKGFDIKK